MKIITKAREHTRINPDFNILQLSLGLRATKFAIGNTKATRVINSVKYIKEASDCATRAFVSTQEQKIVSVIPIHNKPMLDKNNGNAFFIVEI